MASCYIGSHYLNKWVKFVASEPCWWELHIPGEPPPSRSGDMLPFCSTNFEWQETEYTIVLYSVPRIHSRTLHETQNFCSCIGLKQVKDSLEVCSEGTMFPKCTLAASIKKRNILTWWPPHDQEVAVWKLRHDLGDDIDGN